jgi:hypothetical protein
MVAAALSIAGVGVAASAQAQPMDASTETDPRLIDARKKAKGAYPTCDKKEPLKADVERAGEAHTRAKEALGRNDYTTALREWNLAYGADCTRPGVFKNLALAYEGLGDFAMAIAVTEIFLARMPGADPVPLNQQISEWTAKLGPPPKVEPKGEDTTPTKPTTTQPDLETKRPFGPGPWIMFGVGTAALVAGVAVLTVGRINVGDAEAQCGGHTNCTQPQIDLGTQGNTLTGAGAGLLGGGAAIAIGGLIWQFVGNKPVAAGNKADTTGFMSPRVTFEPSLGPGLTGGTLHGSF